MPKWPAYVMGAFALACAYPAITASAPAPAAYGPETAPPIQIPATLTSGAATVTTRR